MRMTLKFTESEVSRAIEEAQSQVRLRSGRIGLFVAIVLKRDRRRQNGSAIDDLPSPPMAFELST